MGNRKESACHHPVAERSETQQCVGSDLGLQAVLGIWICFPKGNWKSSDSFKYRNQTFNLPFGEGCSSDTEKNTEGPVG